MARKVLYVATHTMGDGLVESTSYRAVYGTPEQPDFESRLISRQAFLTARKAGKRCIATIGGTDWYIDDAGYGPEYD